MASRSGRQAASHRLFHSCLSSDIPLPELPLCAQGTPPCIRLRLAAAGEIDSTGFTTSHDWCDADGRLICRSARREEQFLLLFPEQASFLIGPGALITCCPAQGVDQIRLRHLLLNQVLPRYLAHAGELLLHASAVSLPGGRTVAFMGESGRGKSTLASYCHAHGAQAIDDDCILLRFDNSGPSVIGGVPTLRLFPDSLEALGHDPADFEPYADSSEKLQMRLPADGVTDAQESKVLDGLFLLAPPSNPAGVSIEPATGSEATMAIIGSAFSLAPSEPDTMARIFAQAARLLTGDRPLHVNNLRYPRDHACLPQVLSALLDWQRD